MQRQADDGGVAADDGGDEAARHALDGVGPGLALPLVRGEVLELVRVNVAPLSLLRNSPVSLATNMRVGVVGSATSACTSSPGKPLPTLLQVVAASSLRYSFSSRLNANTTLGAALTMKSMSWASSPCPAGFQFAPPSTLLNTASPGSSLPPPAYMVFVLPASCARHWKSGRG